MPKRVLQLTLNRLFLLILVSGVICLGVVGYVLMNQERDSSLKEWQMNVLQRSASTTSSYYAGLIRSLVLNLNQDVQDILDTARQGENLLSITIVSRAEITMSILETCEVDKSQSYFYQIPTCIEYSGRSFFIYHELRSTGYHLGYLRKEVRLPVLGLINDNRVFRGFAFVILCFILVNALILFVIRKFFIRPIRDIINSLSQDHAKLAIVANHAGIKEIELMANAMNNAFFAIEKYRSEAIIGQVASQVAHDIRSPLAALEMVVKQTSQLPEENRLLIRRAVQRIRDIANDLSRKKQSQKPASTATPDQSEAPGVQLLSSLVDTIVSEKRLQYRDHIDVEVDFDLSASAYGLFAAIQSVEFKRVLSNLINNAVEALDSKGKVTVTMSGGEQINIQISDNGKGIPANILPKLMQCGETHGKVGGSGLGLYHARVSVEKWGGGVKITSVVGTGTTITMTLPRAASPSWFVAELNVPEKSSVVVIDDDDSIHQIWKGRFEHATMNHGVTLIHFSSPEAFLSQHDKGKLTDPILYLCDYEFLNHDKTGLDVIRELKFAANAILVTSHFEEDDVRSECEILNVRLMPKNLAGFIPIRCVPPLTSTVEKTGVSRTQDPPSATRDIIDAILIGDDDLVHMNWKMAAKSRNKTVRVYAGPEDFWKDSTSFAKDTPIYVDSNLANGIKGEDVSWMMGKKGFSNLHLATGYDAAQFDEMPWLKSIVGKTPPWK